MDVEFRGPQEIIDEALQAYTRRRITRLERYLPMVREAIVEVRREKTRAADQRYIVQVTVNTNGTFLRAEERAAEPRIAVDQAADALGRQVRRHKAKVYRSERATHQVRHVLEDPLPAEEMGGETEDEDLVAGRVVRVKRFAIKPMSVEEAVEQMELLGHAFFLYFDETERRYALLYRRRDGDYGLILPDTG